MIRETTPDDIRFVVSRLRAVDAEEQFATRFPAMEGDEGAGLASDLIKAMPRTILSFCFVATDGDPATILSAYHQSPGVAKLHRISTDAWPEVSRAVFTFGIERFLPALGASVHRAECSVLGRYAEAWTMLQRLGFTHEGTSIARGRNREDFANFAWVKPDV
jgi:hypothetical protein